MIKVFAPAKINLALHITGQRADGYHLLDSFVIFADVGDWVGVKDGQENSLVVTGVEGANAPTDGRNSVMHAADFLGQSNLEMTLEKNLPTAAGIGGGTADAAAAIKAICELRQLPVPDDVFKLGADVPVSMASVATRMQGIGDKVSPISNLPEIACILVNPRVGVSTQSVFKALKNKENTPIPAEIPGFSSAKDLALWLREQRNDLEPPACEIEPVIVDALTVLNTMPDVLVARMSGSGATCFALFEAMEQAQMATAQILRIRPNWWVKPARLT